MPVVDPVVPRGVPGRRPRPRREQGVPAVSSVLVTHGPQIATREMFLYNEVPTWSRGFGTRVAEALARGDVDTLADHRRAPGTPYAHPDATTAPAAPPSTVSDDFEAGSAERPRRSSERNPS